MRNIWDKLLGIFDRPMWFMPVIIIFLIAYHDWDPSNGSIGYLVDKWAAVWACLLLIVFNFYRMNKFINENEPRTKDDKAK